MIDRYLMFKWVGVKMTYYDNSLLIKLFLSIIVHVFSSWCRLNLVFKPDHGQYLCTK
jgi:hypothetical protein